MNKVIRRNKNALQDLIKQLKTLSSSEVAVGFPANKGLDTPYYKTGASVIEVAIWNNYGTHKIPARPFFDFASVKIQRRFKARVQADVKLCLAGKLPLKTMLNRWGVESKGVVQQEITDTLSPPNSPSTIAAKRSQHPLIDTGHMRQSVTYVVRKRSE
jgi:hypothetical protein